MKGLFFIILVSCSIIFLGQVRLSAQGSYDISQYFPLDTDDTWIYRAVIIQGREQIEELAVSTIKEKSIVNGKETYVLEINLNQNPRFCYSVDSQGVYLHKMIEDDGYSIFTPPIPVFTNQMQPDKENTFSGKAKLYDNKDELIEEYKIEATNKLEGVESITVPAGKFDNCLKVRIAANYYKKKHTTTTEETLWLAKNIGKIKEISIITVFDEGSNIFRNILQLEKAILQKK